MNNERELAVIGVIAIALLIAFMFWGGHNPRNVGHRQSSKQGSGRQ